MFYNCQKSDQISGGLLDRRRRALGEPFGFLLGQADSLRKRRGGHFFGPIPPGGGLARYGLLTITNIIN